MNQPVTNESIRKRILLFYFVGGANIVMALMVFAAGGTSGIVAGLIFIAFAFLQFYVARNLRRRWEAAMRMQTQGSEAKRDEPKREDLPRDGMTGGAP